MTYEEALTLKNGDHVQVFNHENNKWYDTVVDLGEGGICNIGWVVVSPVRGRQMCCYPQHHVRRKKVKQ